MVCSTDNSKSNTKLLYLKERILTLGKKYLDNSLSLNCPIYKITFFLKTQLLKRLFEEEL